MVYKFRPLDESKFTPNKMKLFIEEFNEVITDRFFTRDEILSFDLAVYPLDLLTETVGDATIDNFLKRVDELGFAVDFVVSDRRVFVTKQNGELIMTIDYDEDLENGYVAEKGFYEIGEYYQIQLDKLIGETNFASLWEE